MGDGYQQDACDIRSVNEIKTNREMINLVFHSFHSEIENLTFIFIKDKKKMPIMALLEANI